MNYKNKKMIYLSIDIETTGLESERHQILSFGAILEDTSKMLPFEDIPKFQAIIIREEITGSPFAINMNRDLIEAISKYKNASPELRLKLSEEYDSIFLKEENLAENFYYWLWDNGFAQHSPEDFLKTIQIKGGKAYPFLNNAKPITINVAGKNFGTFDKKFLEKVPRWKQLINIKQRIIDPSLAFVNWDYDESLPSLDECKKRSGLIEGVSHNALLDAWDVIRLLRIYQIKIKNENKPQ